MSFTVYKSSAGSGKTHTLVKEYLNLVLDNPSKVNRILAITFTNKAANEMKQRIISSLEELGYPGDHPDSKAIKYMLPELLAASGKSQELLAENARLVLGRILHDYSDFAINTIDSFVHRIIRSFAFDLHLPVNFEVEIDIDDLIQKIIGLLISKVGFDENLTKLLVEYTKLKANEEKSWNIEKDLIETTKYISQEDGQQFVKQIQDLEPDDFIDIKKKIKLFVTGFETTLKRNSELAVSLIKSKSLSAAAFAYGSRGIYNYFKNLSLGKFEKAKPGANVLKTVNENNWYAGKASLQDKLAIDEIKERLRSIYQIIEKQIDENYLKYISYIEIYKNLYPLAVIREVQQVIEEYKRENNILPISEFNQRIAEIVLNEPVPFIYEKAGEKFQHFLIDEFQDTSVLQWQNLIPLIDNSLGENNFNMIVGDGKQAIYRWRNGEVEQFVSLPEIYNRKDDLLDLHREKNLKRHYVDKHLDRNYRSKKEIIEFNNDFFATLSKKLPDHLKQIYADHSQLFDNNNTGGSVQVEFFAKEESELNFENFNLERIFEIINTQQKEGYRLKDIAVLCRTNNSASKIATFLLEKNINVISSESLLLGNSRKVQLLISFAKLLLNQNDNISFLELEKILSQEGIRPGNYSAKLEKLESKTNNTGNEQIGQFNKHWLFESIRINENKLRSLPLYDLFEELIRMFDLNNELDPYIQFFLDEVIKLAKQKDYGLPEVIEWWEIKKDKISIVIPENINAVRIMTVHKAKGLEFPIVIYPYANEKCKSSKDKLWVQNPIDQLSKLEVALVNTSSKLENSVFQDKYTDEMQKSLLDLINLLYVLMTRPTDRLFVVTDMPSKSGNTISVPLIFRDYLLSKNLWEDNKWIYKFGNQEVKIRLEDKEQSHYSLETFISNSWRNRILVSIQSPLYWDIKDNDYHKQEWGDLVHLVLSKIENFEQINSVINDFYARGIISEEVSKILLNKMQEFINKPEVSKYFHDNYKIITEKEVLSVDNSIFRPDRVLIGENEVLVIDFKTGKPEPKHKDQVKRYIQVVKDLGYENTSGVLLYFDSKFPEILVN